MKKTSGRSCSPLLPALAKALVFSILLQYFEFTSTLDVVLPPRVQLMRLRPVRRHILVDERRATEEILLLVVLRSAAGALCFQQPHHHQLALECEDAWH